VPSPLFSLFSLFSLNRETGRRGDGGDEENNESIIHDYKLISTEQFFLDVLQLILNVQKFASDSSSGPPLKKEGARQRRYRFN
jgi:hypothetical protein